MIWYTAYTFLVVGLASQTLAEPFREPYQPKLARMSVRNILGLHRREIEGYTPVEQLCGDGDTCAEACGKGFSQCASKDDLTHCYNRSKKQTCCPGGTGDACDNGYFCSADEEGETWCCPEGLSLKECAQKYNIPGPLTSQAPHTSTTSTTKATKTKSASSASSTHTSTRKPATTSTKSKKPEITESTTTSKTVHHESTSKSKPKETTTATPSSSTTTLLIDVSSALVSTEAAATQTTALDLAPSSTPSTPPASSSTSSIGSNGSGSLGPVNGIVLFIAGALAAFV
ncbi:hypothetical protein F5B21DRAFT_311291 [Xylaria acuta]|nr:hypothetical protein F5B21DRAFT_311291 [Xylaria acuta]